MPRGKKQTEKETHPVAYKKATRASLRCPVCPPNRGENSKRQPKHGARKPRGKDHRN